LTRPSRGATVPACQDDCAALPVASCTTPSTAPSVAPPSSTNPTTTPPSSKSSARPTTGCPCACWPGAPCPTTGTSSSGPNNAGRWRFVGWLTLTHTQRWHAHYQSAGSGHLYQGRYKSFPIQLDEHFLTVGRYVERNALRAGLVARAEDWRWGSLWRRTHGTAEAPALLRDWPVRRPRRWLAGVNEPPRGAEREALRRCVRRGQPYGDEGWVVQTAAQLGLDTTLRPRGRPPKSKAGNKGSRHLFFRESDQRQPSRGWRFHRRSQKARRLRDGKPARGDRGPPPKDTVRTASLPALDEQTASHRVVSPRWPGPEN
jgi:hypothetical protein